MSDEQVLDLVKAWIEAKRAKALAKQKYARAAEVIARIDRAIIRDEALDPEAWEAANTLGLSPDELSLNFSEVARLFATFKRATQKLTELRTAMEIAGILGPLPKDESSSWSRFD